MASESPDLEKLSEEGQPARAGDTLDWAAAQLATVTDRPYSEAERLLATILQIARTALLAHPEIEVGHAQLHVYAAAVHRRVGGTPLPYILGQAAFFGLDLMVTPDVLIPRPETELLVEHAIEWIERHNAAELTIVDVGTGSGCIPIALATALPDLRIVATDLSAAALAVARTNGLRHGADHQISWIQADLLTPIHGPCDVIVSNPPYVTEGEWGDLPDSVKQEPRSALLAGPEGLDVIERLLYQARLRLAPQGYMLIEIGARQGSAAWAMARAAFPEAYVAIRQDLAGLDRILEIGYPAQRMNPD